MYPRYRNLFRNLAPRPVLNGYLRRDIGLEPAPQADPPIAHIHWLI